MSRLVPDRPRLTSASSASVTPHSLVQSRRNVSLLILLPLRRRWRLLRAASNASSARSAQSPGVRRSSTRSRLETADQEGPSADFWVRALSGRCVSPYLNHCLCLDPDLR